MSKYSLQFIMPLLVLLSLVPLQVIAADEQKFRLATDEKIVVVGDIHGDFDEFTHLIQAAGIVDTELNWQAGNTHFVSVGDLLDRGPESRQVMDLFMRLEIQAASSGGAVHLVLGNHEQMNLIRDLRYVNKHDYSRYQADDDGSLRDEYWQRYLARSLKTGAETGVETSEEKLQEAFNRDYPPGYFGHMQQFAPDGKYGRWLLSKPSVLQINEVIFVHGGLSGEFPLTTLAQINQESAAIMRDYIEAFEQLKQLGVLTDKDDFFGREQRLKQLAQSQSDDPAVKWSRAFLKADKSFTLSASSQYWYRGSALCHPIFEEQVLDRVLQHYSAKRLVIGHTPTFSKTIESRMNGKVINVDTGLHRKYYQGNPMLLSIDGETLEEFDGSQWQPFEVGGPEFRALYKGRSYQSWEEMLHQASVIAIEPFEEGLTASNKIQLEHNGQRFQAIFNSEHAVPRSAARENYDNSYSYKFEVAAYRIARSIGLYMLPPTVLRKVEGKQGALQLWIDKSFNEAERMQKNHYPSESCVMSYQVSLMNMLDALVYNVGRSQSNVRYTGDWLMWLSDHPLSFRTHSQVPKHLSSANIMHANKLEQALRSLDDDSLEDLTDGLLKSRQVRALLKRRDWLLAHWERAQ